MEAGCGTGGNLQLLASFGDIAAFELDEEARRIAASKMPIDIAEGALPDRIPFPGKSFDVIGAFDVIEHVEKDVESMAALGARLAPGGRLIITVPAFSWLWSPHDETHHHFRRYTRSEMHGKLLAAGLQRSSSATLTCFSFR